MILGRGLVQNNAKKHLSINVKFELTGLLKVFFMKAFTSDTEQNFLQIFHKLISQINPKC